MSEDELRNMEFFSKVPPASKRGPKRGTSGRKSKIFTDAIIRELTDNPGKWLIIKEGATVNQNSNAISWTRRHPGFKTVCRKLPDNPEEAPLTIFATYNPEEDTEKDKK